MPGLRAEFEDWTKLLVCRQLVCEFWYMLANLSHFVRRAILDK
jgi:hypothetical protein